MKTILKILNMVTIEYRIILISAIKQGDAWIYC